MAPIKGLTDNLRMPRAGKIHLGLPMEGRSYPQPTDYFVCPPEVIDAIGEDKPKELTIMFPTEDPEQFAPTFYKLFARGRGLLCKGDGETAGRKVNIRQILGADGVLSGIPNTPEAWPVATPDANPADVGMRTIECRGPACPQHGPKGCGRMMMLQFLLPDVPGLGIYQIDTGSRNGILNIYGAVELIRAMVGRVSMIPLTLKIGPLQTVSPETGKAQTNYVMTLSCDFSIHSMEQYKQLGPSGASLSRQLPEPDDEVPTDLIEADTDATSQPQSVAPPIDRPKPPAPPSEPPQSAKSKKAKPEGYNAAIWGMSNKQLIEKLEARRDELGITPEALAEHAKESVGPDDYKVMKPDQFIALMDWMAAEFGEATPGDQASPAVTTEGDENGEHATDDTQTQRATDDGDEHIRDGAETTQADQPQSTEGEDPTLEQRLAAIPDDQTWEQTLELASEFGFTTSSKFEREVLRGSKKEWVELHDGTPATAAKRLLLSEKLKANQAAEVAVNG